MIPLRPICALGRESQPTHDSQIRLSPSGSKQKRKQRSAMSVSSGVRGLPGVSDCEFGSIAAEAPIP